MTVHGEPDVLDLFERSASRFDFDNGTTRTALELVDEGRRLATWLGSQGVEPGDRVAVWLHNRLEYLQLLLACAAGGFVAVSVNTRYSDAEVAELVERSGARFVDFPPVETESAVTESAITESAITESAITESAITESAITESAITESAITESAITESAITESADTGSAVDSGVAAGRSGWTLSKPAPRSSRRDDPFIVFTTSGTTSRPKMVLHRQHSIADHAIGAAPGVGYRADDTVLAVMPLCGIFGLSSMLIAVAAGSRIIVTDYDLERTAALIESEGVTCLNGTDDLFHRLLDRGANLSSIRLGGYARFNTSLDGVVERADAAGATLTGLYGMSEVQAVLTLRDPTGDATQRTRAGGTLTAAQAEYRIIDGELQLRGPSLFAGYLAEGGEHVDAELTEANHDDGWFRTGDLAEAEDDRSFEYLARMGDALRLGGFLVSPAEIEAVLMDDVAVAAAQVVAVDRPNGARPVGFVVVATGNDDFDEDIAIARCRDRLARYKVPVRVISLDEFPTTLGPNGTKIQKNRLRDLATAALDVTGRV